MEESGKAFVKLKAALCSGPVLQSPNMVMSLWYKLMHQTVGWEQFVSGGLERGEVSQAYFSRKLLPWEERYGTVHLDTHPGEEVPVKRYHQALEWMKKMKADNSRLTQKLKFN